MKKLLIVVCLIFASLVPANAGYWFTKADFPETKNFTLEKKAEAATWLSLARDRQHKGNVENEISHFMNSCIQAVTPFEEYGITSDELVGILLNGYRNEAVKQAELADARKLEKTVEFEMLEAKEFAKLAKTSLPALGFSEKWQTKTLLTSYESEAKLWLRFAREHQHKMLVNVEVDNIKKYATLAKKSLTEIGTSNKEMALMLANGEKAENKSYIKAGPVPKFNYSLSDFAPLALDSPRQ